jgi:hypothetical protein
MDQTAVGRASSAAYGAAEWALAALGPENRDENLRRVCGLLREIFGNPFRPLQPRPFPAHVVGLARECYEAFPAESDRFPILADALDDLGEGVAAEHCRQGGHFKGCHVIDWVLGRK